MSITTALEARRDALREREAGFTLIELLVVVIIIGILAAIAIPIYLGVTNGAKESATKSDLTNAKTAITGFAVENNGLIPTTVANDEAGTTTGGNAVALKTYGWSKSNNTTSLTYTPSGVGTTAGVWCLQGVSATNPGSGDTGKYFISTNKPVTKGTCPAAATDY